MAVVLRLFVELHVRVVAIPAQVIPCQIYQHHVFGILLRVGQQGFGQCGIRLFVSTSAGGAGNGVDGGLSLFNLAMRFGRGTENPETAEIKIEQVRRRIDASQRPVEGEIIALIALDETSGKHNLKHVASLAVGNALADIGLVLLVGQRTGGVARRLKCVGGVVAVQYRLFHFINVARLVVALQLHQHHLALEVVEHNQVLVENVENLRRIVLRVAAVFHRNLFEIADGIERGVAVHSSVAGIFSFHLKLSQEILESIFHLELGSERTFFTAFVRKDRSHDSVVYGETGNGVQSDKRAVVFHSVIIGTFQQNALRKQVAHFQVRAHRRMQVAGQRFVVGGISKFLHGFFSFKNFQGCFCISGKCQCLCRLFPTRSAPRCPRAGTSLSPVLLRHGPTPVPE